MTSIKPEILNQNQTENGENSKQTSELVARREMVKNQIISFYLSARRDQPNQNMMEIEINLAVSDWEEIPSEHLLEICTEARRSSGSFLASNGSVVTLWRERQAELRRPKISPFVALPLPERTESEIDEIKAMCRRFV